jgi:hypothetical protein
VRSLDKVKFFSVVHPDGILIDYQVVPIENLQVGDEEITTPRIMLAKPQVRRLYLTPTLYTEMCI